MIKRVKPMYVIPQLLLSQKEKYSFSTTFKFYLGELMKKRIANGLELLLLLVSFIILWLPTLKVQHVDLIRDLPLDAYALGLVPRGNVYIIFFFYAITALMCIISIFVKSEHRDGKMHVIMPILLFLWTAPMLHVQVGTVVDEWEIVESTFPIYLFLGCLLSVFIISIVKRSTVIAGLPKVITIQQQSTNADELKKYKDLLDSGAITQEEYNVKKNELLR